MRIHFLDRTRTAKAGFSIAWCGLRSKDMQTTTTLTQVTCTKCREAFARELAKLPDVFPRKD